MNRFSCAAMLLTAVWLASCSDPTTAVFVTNSSLGINFDSSPPTANIAYDRTEGFIGPRYQNGGAPSAVASIETGGTIFNPKIRQVYATGDAANAVTAKTEPAERRITQPELSGDAKEKRLMFFGTTTTVGLKVGFAPSGAPDSLLFGYRRKEASIIPLAETINEDKSVSAVYPPVLASIRVNVQTKTAEETGLSSKQFFATGNAAVALGGNPKVRKVFENKAAKIGSLTESEEAEAKLAGTTLATTTKDQLAKITEQVTATDGSLDKAKLAQIVQAARLKNPRAVPIGLETNYPTVGSFRDHIQGLPTTVQVLYAELPSPS